MNKVLIENIEYELGVRVLKLKGMSFDEIKNLDGKPIKENIEIEGKLLEFSSWSEPAVNEDKEALAVLVDVWQKHLISSTRHMKGFLLKPSGYVRELSENELWEYD